MTRFSLKPAEAERLAKDWSIAWFTSDEAETWWDAGFGPDDRELVVRCISAELKTKQMRQTYRGIRIVSRIKDGESPESIAVELRSDD